MFDNFFAKWLASLGILRFIFCFSALGFALIFIVTYAEKNGFGLVASIPMTSLVIYIFFAWAFSDNKKTFF